MSSRPSHRPRIRPTEEPTVPAEEATPTEEPDPTEEPEPTEEPTIPAEEPTEEPTEPDVPETEVEPDQTAAQQVVGDPEPKVTICHRTADPTNPYNQITVTIPHARTGHADLHHGPIFRPRRPEALG